METEKLLLGFFQPLFWLKIRHFGIEKGQNKPYFRQNWSKDKNSNVKYTYKLASGHMESIYILNLCTIPYLNLRLVYCHQIWFLSQVVNKDAIRKLREVNIENLEFSNLACY